MELRELRTFVAVVEEGGFSAAGRRLYLSQPAISHIIRGLERRLEVELLVRTKTGVSATPAGRTLLYEARALIARHAQAAASMAFHCGADSAELRLAVPMELPAELLAAVLAKLSVNFPTTAVTVRHLPTAAQIAALCRADLDIGLLRQRPTEDGLETLMVLEEQLGVLLATDEAIQLETADGISLESLHNLTWLGFDRSTSPAWHDELTAVMRAYGLPVGQSPLHAGQPTFEVKLAAVSAGGVFALAPAR